MSNKPSQRVAESSAVENRREIVYTTKDNAGKGLVIKQ